MTRETKLGLAAIGVLSAAFAGVLTMRLAGPGDPTSPVAVEPADSKQAAARQTGSDARLLLGSTGAEKPTKTVADGPFSSRNPGRPDPFGSSTSRPSTSRPSADTGADDPQSATSDRYGRSIAPADQDDPTDLIDEGSDGLGGERYGRGYRADEEFTDEEFDQEIPDADDRYSEGRQETIEGDATWDEELAIDRYRSRLPDADRELHADDAEADVDESVDTDRTLVARDANSDSEAEPSDGAVDPTGWSDDEPALIDDQDSLRPLAAEDEEFEDAEAADAPATWRVRGPGASRAGYESDRPSRRPLSNRRLSRTAVDGDEEPVGPSGEISGDETADVLQPEPMSLDADRYAPPPRSRPLTTVGDTLTTDGFTADAPTADGTYIVVQGDSLFDIAHRQLGSAARWVEIYDLNRDALGTELEHPPVGLELALPAIAPAPTPRVARPGASRRRPSFR